ncbi:MAG: DUF1801 domain-containing protein [Bacteroidota bacterium]
MMVEDFILDKEGAQREILHYLHELLEGQLDLTPKIRYKIPFYYRKTWICYLNPIKNDGIELAFLRGYQLSNDQGLLSAKGRKQVMGLEIYELEGLPLDSLLEVLQEAILLDEEIPYTFKKTKK